MRSLIGLDVGTSGVKAVAISPDGELLASAEEGYALSTPQPGWAEQDPEDWWRAAQSCLARLPEGPIGFAGQMHGLVVLGDDDHVLRPAMLALQLELPARERRGRLSVVTDAATASASALLIDPPPAP